MKMTAEEVFGLKSCDNNSSSSSGGGDDDNNSNIANGQSEATVVSNNVGGHSTKIRLLSPVGAEPAEFEWPLKITVGSGEKKFNPIHEIFETIRLVSAEFPDLKIALENNVLSKYEPNCKDNIKLLCDKYNKVITQVVQMWKGTSVQSEKPPSTELLHHIIQMCYNHSVGDPLKLNKCYEPFSPEVYGETSFLFVQQMIDQIGFSDQDVFIDLGSGVGQVVLHVAAIGKCKRCIGIEKADLPAAYAEEMGRLFKFWMNWFGKRYSPFELIKGDFLLDNYKPTVERSSFIFVNNFVFGPDVDLRLARMFESLPDGAKILASKAFCPPNFRISNRNLDNIGAIMKVEEIMPMDNQPVSWTGKRISYHLHTIDRARLERYFEEIQQIKQKSLDKKNRKETKKRPDKSKSSRNSSSSMAVSPNGDSQTSDEGIPNKWTRKAWQEFTEGTTSAITCATTSSSIPTTSNGNNLIKSPTTSVHEKGSPRKKVVRARKPASKKRSRGRPKKVSSPAQAEEIKAESESEENEERIVESVSITKRDEKKISASKSEPVEHAASRKHRKQDEPKVEQSNESTRLRRPGRPKKATVKKPATKKKIRGINFSSLEVLHAKTMASIDSNQDTGIRLDSGCVDQKLCVQLSKKAVPNIVVVDQEMTEVDHLVSPDIPKIGDKRFPSTIEEHCLLYKYNLMKFNQYIKFPMFREQLLARLKQEQDQNEKLTETLNKMNKQIYEQKYQVIQSLKKFGAQTFDDLHFGKEMIAANNSEMEARLEELKAITKQLKEENDVINKQKEIAEAEEAKLRLENNNAATNNNQVNSSNNYYQFNANLEMKTEISTPDSNVSSKKVDEIHTAAARPFYPTEPPGAVAESMMNGNLEGPQLQMDMNRIHSTIKKAMVEPKPEVMVNSVHINNNNNNTTPSKASNARSNETKGGGNKRTRKAKTETIKTTKKDSQVIMNMGGNGMATTHVVHINKDKEKSKETTKEAKRFPLKLKINCKSNSVAVLDSRTNEESSSEVTTNKRKLSTAEEVNPAAKKKSNSSNNKKASSNEVVAVVENKIPPVRLKKSNSKEGGQYYHSVNDTNKATPPTIDRNSETNSPSFTAKNVEYSATTLPNGTTSSGDTNIPNGFHNINNNNDDPAHQYQTNNNNISPLPEEQSVYGKSGSSSRSFSSRSSSFEENSNANIPSSNRKSRRKNANPNHINGYPAAAASQHHFQADVYNLYSPRTGGGGTASHHHHQQSTPPPPESIISSLMQNFAQQQTDASSNFFNAPYGRNGIPMALSGFGSGAGNPFLAKVGNNNNNDVTFQQYKQVVDSFNIQSLYNNFQQQQKSKPSRQEQLELLEKAKNGDLFGGGNINNHQHHQQPPQQHHHHQQQQPPPPSQGLVSPSEFTYAAAAAAAAAASCNFDWNASNGYMGKSALPVVTPNNL